MAFGNLKGSLSAALGNLSRARKGGWPGAAAYGKGAAFNAAMGVAKAGGEAPGFDSLASLVQGKMSPGGKGRRPLPGKYGGNASSGPIQQMVAELLRARMSKPKPQQPQRRPLDNARGAEWAEQARMMVNPGQGGGFGVLSRFGPAMFSHLFNRASGGGFGGYRPYGK